MEGMAGPEGRMQLIPENSNTKPGGTDFNNGIAKSAPVAIGIEKNKKRKKRKRMDDSSLQSAQRGRKVGLEQAAVKKPTKEKHKNSLYETHCQATEITNLQKACGADSAQVQGKNHKSNSTENHVQETGGVTSFLHRLQEAREAELEDATMKKPKKDKHKSSHIRNHGQVIETVLVVENSCQSPLEVSKADPGQIGAENTKDERRSNHTENHGQEIGVTKSFLQRLQEAREVDLNQVALKKQNKKKHKSCHIENHGRVTENAPILENIWQSHQEVREADSEQVGAKKHDSSHTKHHSEETESVLALTDLRNDTNPDHSYDNELASSQLQGENSQVLLNSSHEFEDLLKETSGQIKKLKRSIDERDQSGSKGSTALDSVAKEDREAIRDLLSPTKKAAYIPTHEENLPHSTIDEMDSNDEAVVLYLREYQTQFSSPRSPISHSTEMIGHVPGGNVSTHEVETPEERPAEPYNNEMLTYLSPPRYDAPNEHKSKNYRWIEKSVPIVNDEWFNKVGNVTVDHPRLARSSGEEGLAVKRMEIHDSSKPNDTAAQQEARLGKLKCVSSKKRKQRGDANEKPKSSTIAFRDSQEVPQDRREYVLPGLMDTQVQPSQNQESSQPSQLPKSTKQPISRSVHRPADYNPPVAELAKKGGMFTSAESEKIYSFRDSYCTEHNMTQDQFALERVQVNANNNTQLSEFWSEVEAVLPYRNRQSIIKFCRRQFHTFSKRGTWTEEEDQDLRDAIDLKGKRWVAVAEICERLPEDCRDRYRNYLVCNPEVKNSKSWTDAECKDLCRAVGECIYLLRKDRHQRKALGIEDDMDADSEDEQFIDAKLINWAIVSDRMEGSRSRLQCLYKWNAMKNIERKRYQREVRETGKKMAHLIKTGKLPESRVIQAQKKVASRLLPGDKCDILRSVLRCGVRSDEMVDWKLVGEGEEWRDRWVTTDLKMAWEQIKGSSEAAEGGFIEQVRTLLQDLMDKESDRLDERYKPGKRELKTMKRKRAKELNEATSKADHGKEKEMGKTVSKAKPVEDDVESVSGHDENTLHSSRPAMEIDDVDIDPSPTGPSTVGRSRSKDSLGLDSD